MDAVPLHLFSLLGLNIKMEAPKEADDDHDPEDEAHAESKGWVYLTHCISTTATAEPETIAVQLTAGRGKYSCHVWPKFQWKTGWGNLFSTKYVTFKRCKMTFLLTIRRWRDSTLGSLFAYLWVDFGNLVLDFANVLDSMLSMSHYTISNTPSYR